MRKTAGPIGFTDREALESPLESQPRPTPALRRTDIRQLTDLTRDDVQQADTVQDIDLVPPAPSIELIRAAKRKAMMLQGPVLTTLLLLAVPNIAVIALQAAANFLESYYVGLIGLDGLAGAALVFPLVMLMQTMAAGGIGGAISGAIARAVGSGQRDKAEALALHAFVIAVCCGVAFTVAAVAFGPAIYGAMGGRGNGLSAAIAYSNVIFGGAIFVWLMNALASVLRGAGNMLLPAVVLVSGVVALLGLSPLLIFGWGIVPPLGMAGAGLALVLYYAGGSGILLTSLVRGKGGLRFSLRHRLRRELFGEILAVGALGAANNVLTNLAVILATGLVGTFGIEVLVGFGLGIRVEYLQIPLVFGIGSGMTPMIGMNVGAGQQARARKVAWVGALVAAAVTEAVGLLAAVFPGSWLRLLTDDPQAVAAGSVYLRQVGPFYAFLGISLAFYFASQGANRMMLPTLAALFRVLIIVAGGSLAIRFGGFSLVLVVIVLAHATSAGVNGLNWVRRR